MTQTNDIRRRANGSIDLDFYRAGATALRGQAMRDASKLRNALAGILAMAGILGIVTVLASIPRTTGSTAIAAGWIIDAQTLSDPI